MKLPLSAIRMMAAGIFAPLKKPRRKFTKCQRCGNHCRGGLCFKCETALKAERDA